jgi:hypothetical protein
MAAAPDAVRSTRPAHRAAPERLVEPGLEQLRGSDQVTGRSGSDQVTGRSGNDQVTGRSGNDQVTGRSGNDQVTGRSGNDQVTERSGSGARNEIPARCIPGSRARSEHGAGRTRRKPRRPTPPPRARTCQAGRGARGHRRAGRFGRCGPTASTGRRGAQLAALAERSARLLVAPRRIPCQRHSGIRSPRRAAHLGACQDVPGVSPRVREMRRTGRGLRGGAACDCTTDDPYVDGGRRPCGDRGCPCARGESREDPRAASAAGSRAAGAAGSCSRSRSRSRVTTRAHRGAARTGSCRRDHGAFGAGRSATPPGRRRPRVRRSHEPDPSADGRGARRASCSNVLARESRGFPSGVPPSGVPPHEARRQFPNGGSRSARRPVGASCSSRTGGGRHLGGDGLWQGSSCTQRGDDRLPRGESTWPAHVREARCQPAGGEHDWPIRARALGGARVGSHRGAGDRRRRPRGDGHRRRDHRGEGIRRHHRSCGQSRLLRRPRRRWRGRPAPTEASRTAHRRSAHRRTARRACASAAGPRCRTEADSAVPHR